MAGDAGNLERDISLTILARAGNPLAIQAVSNVVFLVQA